MVEKCRVNVTIGHKTNVNVLYQKYQKPRNARFLPYLAVIEKWLDGWNLPTNKLTSLTLKSGSGILQNTEVFFGCFFIIFFTCNKQKNKTKMYCIISNYIVNKYNLLYAKAVTSLKDDRVPESFSLYVFKCKIYKDFTKKKKSGIKHKEDFFNSFNYLWETLTFALHMLDQVRVKPGTLQLFIEVKRSLSFNFIVWNSIVLVATPCTSTLNNK